MQAVGTQALEAGDALVILLDTWLLGLVEFSMHCNVLARTDKIAKFNSLRAKMFNKTDKWVYVDRSDAQ